MESSSTTSEGVRALVSVHDLMPETMPAVRRTLDRLAEHRIAPATLLVVPGAGWDAAGIAELRRLQDAGYRLAGHGWQHHVDAVTRPYHRLHSLLISRRVAEHLALDEGAILDLLHRCRDWFDDHGLQPPALYVPPAWAMGTIGRARLATDGPFALYELFGGVFDAAARRWHAIPMLGYEADRAARVPVIRAWNALNRRRAGRCGLLRIGIHPFDTTLRVAADLDLDLSRYRMTADYADLQAIAGEAPQAPANSGR